MLTIWFLFSALGCDPQDNKDDSGAVLDSDDSSSETGGPGETGETGETGEPDETGLRFLDVEGLSPGDLVISEVMVDPDKCDDGKGEYFEIYNASGAQVDLAGLQLSASAETVTLTDSLVIEPGAYVLGRKETSSDCYQLDPLFRYALSLNNSGDVLTLSSSSGVIDALDFQGWTVPTGKALNLAPDALDASSNDLESSWCASTTPLGMGIDDAGTPGAPNDTCAD